MANYTHITEAHPLCGRVITCSHCERMWRLQIGDRIHEATFQEFPNAKLVYGKSKGFGCVTISTPPALKLGCGHLWPIPEDER